MILWLYMENVALCGNTVTRLWRTGPKIFVLVLREGEYSLVNHVATLRLDDTADQDEKH